MQSARIPDKFTISKEIKKDLCAIFVKSNLFTKIKFLFR